MGAQQGKEAARLFNTKRSEMDKVSSSCRGAPSLSRIECRQERMQSIHERRNKQGIDKVQVGIEASKAHWSQLVPTSVDKDDLATVERDDVAADNVEVFEKLRKQWPSVGGHKFSWQWSGGDIVVYEQPFALKSFWNWHYDDLVNDEKPIAEGGQALIYEALGIDYDKDLVLMVFKEKSSLRDLQGLLPHAILGHESTRSSGYFSGGIYCNGIYGATLTKSGRFRTNVSIQQLVHKLRFSSVFIFNCNIHTLISASIFWFNLD